MFAATDGLSRREAVREACRAFRTTWIVSRRWTLALPSVRLADALIPACSAYAFGRLVGAVRAAAESEQISGQFVFWLCVALSLLLSAALTKVAGTYVSDALGRQIELHISRDVLHHLAKLDQEFFEDSSCQDMIVRVRNHPGRHCFTFVTGSIQTVAAVVQVVSIMAVLIWIDIPAALLLASLAIPVAVIQWRLSTTRYQMERNKVTKKRWTSYYLKTCSAPLKTPTLKVFDLFALMADRFGSNMCQLNEIDSKTARKQAVAHITEAMILMAGLLIAGIRLGSRTATGALGMEGFVIFWAAAGRFRSSLESLQSSAGQTFESVLFLQELGSFFRESPVITPDKGIEPEELRGKITLRDVAFTYRGGNSPAVRRINLDLQPGEIVAIVGPNGAGKTTLAKLIMRLYNISEGTICVDGHDVRELRLSSYHRQIGYVGHFPIEFEAGIAENIAYGDWRHLLRNRERVREIAGTLGMDEMIEQMPHGYDTRLGGRFGDYNLSAGQWQKVAIARAIARDPAILILDEPTANLDARYEFDLLSALRRFSQGKTTIIISHRLTTLQMADRIVVMEDGQITDSGSHDDLISRDGMYAQLYRTQTQAAA